MRYNHKIIAFVLMLMFCASVSASGGEVDRYIETQMRTLHIPGMSLAVVRDGRIVKTKGYGLANIEANSAGTSKTVYGSITKQLRYRIGLGGNPYWISFKVMKDGKIAQIYNS